MKNNNENSNKNTNNVQQQKQHSEVTMQTVFQSREQKLEVISNAVRQILVAIGEDVNRDGLKETPQRVAKSYLDICSGLLESKPKLTTFDEDVVGQIISITDIPLYSLCEHHLLPFFGRASISFIPSEKKILGLSKAARLTKHICNRPQVQERITREIAREIASALPVRGVYVRVSAEHCCMIMRGAHSVGSHTTTQHATGIFLEKPELLQQIK